MVWDPQQSRQSMLGKERGLQTVQAEQVPPVNILSMRSNESEAIMGHSFSCIIFGTTGLLGQKEAKRWGKGSEEGLISKMSLLANMVRKLILRCGVDHPRISVLCFFALLSG